MSPRCITGQQSHTYPYMLCKSFVRDKADSIVFYILCSTGSQYDVIRTGVVLLTHKVLNHRKCTLYNVFCGVVLQCAGTFKN